MLEEAVAFQNVLYQLKEQLRECPGAKLTISLPCTVWCQWQQMAIARYGDSYKKKLEVRREEAIEMLKVAQLVLDLGGQIAFEWPLTSEG